MFLQWLKHYMPTGIYARAALILLLPVVFLQLVVTVIFAERHFERVTLQMTTTALREVRLVLEQIGRAENRAAVAQRVASEIGTLEIAVAPVDPADIPERLERLWDDYSGTIMARLLYQEMAGLRGIDLRDDKRVKLFVDTQKGPFLIEFDRRRISAINPHQLFATTLFFGILMSVIAMIYLRNQLRPIKRLARAAEAFGRGRNEPYSPSGAVELRVAGNAFLDMRGRIERHIEQRTLMLSGVSHDLRTPLTRLRLGLSMIDEEDAAPLLRDVDDMQGMLDEFLNFARGAAEGEPEEIEPQAFLKDIVASAQRAGHDVTLRAVEGEGAGTVRLRAVAMRRAVDNLISNAVRYGRRAEVSMMLSDKALRLRVEDDGPGIPEARRAEATRPFIRLDPARNQNQGGGVGLGLAITNDIARAHGGVLRLGQSDRLGGLRADIVIAR